LRGQVTTENSHYRRRKNIFFLKVIFSLSLLAAPSDNYNYTPAAAIFPLLVKIHASMRCYFYFKRRPRADESNCGPFLLCRFNCAPALYAACFSRRERAFHIAGWVRAAADCAPLKTSPRFNEPGGEKLFLRGDLKFRLRPSADFISSVHAPPNE
jgi:hypothetical protein